MTANEKSWFTKHIDTIIVLGVLFTGWWNFNGRFIDLDKRLNCLENRLTKIETVLILQKIMPQDFCAQNTIEE